MIDNFIPYYPDLSGTDNQQVIYNLEEFRSLEADFELENLSGPGTYYKHQIVVARLMNNLDRLFLIHKPGSGKTCTMVGWDELLKENSAVIDQVFYITSNALVTSVKMQILCKCTNGQYITPNILRSSTEQALATNISLSIKKWYTVWTYNELFKAIQGKRSYELDNIFSGKAFNIDEVDNIIPLKNKKKKGDIGENREDFEFHHDISRIDEPSTLNSSSEYIQFWRLFHSINRSKVIIATATPMKNRVYELFMLCNLLLPSDNQMNVQKLSSKEGNYVKSDFTNLKFYAPYFTNLFSYIGSPNTGAYPNYIGSELPIKYNYIEPVTATGETGDVAEWSNSPEFKEKIIPSQIILYKVEMFSLQAEVHYEYTKLSKNSKNFYVVENQITCYVNPSRQYGSSANDKAMNKLIFSNSNDRRQTASKFDFIFNNEIELYNFTKGKPGFSFAYSELTEAGGVYLRDIFLANEYTLVNLSEIDLSNSTICSTATLQTVKMKPGKRIAFVDSSTSSNDRERILNLCGSRANVNGEYVQLLIGSGVLGVGVNIGNALRFYRINPEWNEAAETQTRDRIFRADSYNYVRDLIITKQKTENTYVASDKITIPVNFYNMCSFSRFYTFPLTNISLIFQPASIISTGVQLRIDSTYVAHFVGFYRKLEPYPFSNLKIQNDMIPYTYLDCDYPEPDFLEQELRDSFGKKITVLSIYGMLYLCDLAEYSKTYSILVTQNGYFTEERINGIYENIFSLLGTESFIPLTVEVVSGNEEKYRTAESKSIPISKPLRYAKQYANDCLINAKKNYINPNRDGSVDCDFSRCQYSCVSTIAKEQNDILIRDPTVYFSDSPIFDNFDLLYSSSIIAECAREIIKIIIKEGTLNVNTLFENFLPRYRKYFIFEAINFIITSKKAYRDSFGFVCYVVFNGLILFLKRDYPIEINPLYVGDYINKLIGVTSQIDYLSDQIDADKISVIENYSTEGKSDSESLSDIIKLLKSFDIYGSNQIMLEKSLTRLISHTPLPSDRFVYEFFKSRVYHIQKPNLDVYVHNLSKNTPPTTKYDKANFYIKPKIPFRIFINGKFDNATIEQQKFLEEYAQEYVENIINTIVLHNNPSVRFYISYMENVTGTELFLIDRENKNNTIKIAKGTSQYDNSLTPEIILNMNTYFNSLGIPSNFPEQNYVGIIISFFNIHHFIYEVSRFYTYYINGDYFIVDRSGKNNSGKNIKNLESSFIISMNDYFVSKGYNINFPINNSSGNYRQQIINFFEMNSLVHYFTVKAVMIE